MTLLALLWAMWVILTKCEASGQVWSPTWKRPTTEPVIESHSRGTLRNTIDDRIMAFTQDHLFKTLFAEKLEPVKVSLSNLCKQKSSELSLVVERLEQKCEERTKSNDKLEDKFSNQVAEIMKLFDIQFAKQQTRIQQLEYSQNERDARVQALEYVQSEQDVQIKALTSTVEVLEQQVYQMSVNEGHLTRKLERMNSREEQLRRCKGVWKGPQNNVCEACSKDIGLIGSSVPRKSSVSTVRSNTESTVDEADETIFSDLSAVLMDANIFSTEKKKLGDAPNSTSTPLLADVMVQLAADAEARRTADELQLIEADIRPMHDQKMQSQLTTYPEQTSTAGSAPMSYAGVVSSSKRKRVPVLEDSMDKNYDGEYIQTPQSQTTDTRASTPSHAKSCAYYPVHLTDIDGQAAGPKRARARRVIMKSKMNFVTQTNWGELKRLVADLVNRELAKLDRPRIVDKNVWIISEGLDAKGAQLATGDMWIQFVSSDHAEAFTRHVPTHKIYWKYTHKHYPVSFKLCQSIISSD